MVHIVSFKRLGAFPWSVVPAVLLLFTWSGSSWAQTTGYVHHWSTVDGGGLILSTSGTIPGIRVSGTIGQPDAGILTGGSYRLVGGLWGGAYRAVTSVESEGSSPQTFRASSPRPNPSHGRIVLAFELPARREVTLSVFDLSGRLVRSIRVGSLGPGAHAVAWDGRTSSGTRAGSGIYFTRIRAGEFTAQGRVALLND